MRKIFVSVSPAIFSALILSASLSSCSLHIGTSLSSRLDARASRVSGVAPLAVQFWIELPEEGPASADFHELLYSWDFGDPESGAWGPTGRSRNASTGPVAAHVYERPGIYRVSVSARGIHGNRGVVDLVISVDDPDSVYAGAATVCVSDTASPDFSGAPPGALLLSTDDLSTVAPLATAGRRILFRRGSSWTADGLEWPENAGPVSIGAYGTGSGADEFGIQGNAPRITVASSQFMRLDGKQDWRIMDLALSDPTRSRGSLGGAMEMQRILFLRLRIEGFEVALGWSHWNTDIPMAIDQMAIVSCDLGDSMTNVAYVGSERLALLGNRMRDARESHVLRVWQCWRGVIAENEISGASLDNDAGRHALKYHGPKEEELAPAEGNGHLARRSGWSLVSGNVFGGSGPWPINIAPQDRFSDERITGLIFERNRYHADQGSQSPTPLQAALRVHASGIVVRNNIIDASGGGNDFTGIWVVNEGIRPPPEEVLIYHNTIFSPENRTGNHRTGILVDPGVVGTALANNLVAFPDPDLPIALFQDGGTDSLAQNNLLTGSPAFTDAYHATPGSRDFSLTALSPGIDGGVPVPLLEDFAGAERPLRAWDLGAYEWRP